MRKISPILALVLMTTFVAGFAQAAAPLDFDGDGKTDIAVYRLIPQPSGIRNYEWWIQSSANPSNSTSTQFGYDNHWVGTNTYDDELVPRDYDGDNKTDIAIWRAEETGFFYVLRSTDATVMVDQFGTYLDNPHATADFDGDGVMDLAVLRTPDVSNPQNEFIYRGSLNNPTGNLTYVGIDGSTNPSLIKGDFNGDGRADFGVRRKNSNQIHLRFSNTLSTEVVTFGTATDYIQTGDYDGDGKTDFAFTRGNSRRGLEWYILERDGGGTGTLNPIYFGSSYTASNVSEKSFFGHDFDGDGRSDLMVTERSTSTGLTFLYRRSSDGAVRTVNFGLFNDAVIRNYR